MSWLRRQRVALLALAVAIVAVVGAYVWLDVLPGIRPAGRVIEADSTADVAGQTLSLSGAEWGEFEAPEGTRSLSVRMTSSGGPEAGSCTISISEPSTSRTWLSSRDGLDVPYDEDERSCTIEGSSYRILAVFLLPDDAEGPFLLDVEDGDHVTARFLVEP